MSKRITRSMLRKMIMNEVRTLSEQTAHDDFDVSGDVDKIDLPSSTDVKMKLPNVSEEQLKQIISKYEAEYLASLEELLPAEEAFDMFRIGYEKSGSIDKVLTLYSHFHRFSKEDDAHQKAMAIAKELQLR